MACQPQASVNGVFADPIRLQHLLDDLPMGVMLTDNRRRVVLKNRQLELLTGFSLQEVKGTPCRDVMRTDQCLASCLADEAEARDCTVSRRCDIIDRDRRKVMVNATSVPLRNDSGEVIGFMETFTEANTVDEDPESVATQMELGGIVGRSPAMAEVFRILPVIAQTDSSVLITGETGTGKDLLAEIIHRNSPRADGPFIKINCGSLPENLLESELFGHAKGAFTGAVADKMGRLRMAHNGTVFLTEVGDLPLSLQVKLLTYLDDKVVHPLGSTREFQTDVRVIAATHRDLEAMVAAGGFRKDLLFRLNVVRVSLPPLRRRQGDVPLLLDHFLKRFSARFNKEGVDMDGQARAFLLSYDYPGNVRELRNIVEYAVSICRGRRIQLDELPAYLFDRQPVQTEHEAQHWAGEGATPQSTEPSSSDMDHRASWAQVERSMILDALRRAGGRKAAAAKALGWSRSTLWRKMKRHGVGL
ncbi:sigma-54 interaction domain-containing protein [Desulfohalovibrio reitneri]|uniref:sigma-54 interaction domain-containing protein n=1 Tax=Desulfohalovibrio reitneri TaxID=1307759 RepID=UPI001F001A0B|nr:sigma 54-interacting transcriptional regulator [Desulfohalovibrio reitneri]